jgi:hypothetical protein
MTLLRSQGAAMENGAGLFHRRGGRVNGRAWKAEGEEWESGRASSRKADVGGSWVEEWGNNRNAGIAGIAHPPFAWQVRADRLAYSG